MPISEIEAQIEQLLKQNVGVQRIKAQLHVGQNTILSVKERLGIKSTKNNPKPAAPKRVASIAPSIPEYSSPSIPEITKVYPSIPECPVCGLETGICCCKPEPAAKPEGHLDPPIFPTNLDGTTPSHSSFSGARAGQDKPFVDFEPEFTLKDKLKAQNALEAILKRSKQAIGYGPQEGLKIAKKIIDSLLA